MAEGQDVIIIGGGHNGLTAAAYLGRAGLRTLVLEKRPILGGACVTEETFPGFKLNTFAYAAGLLRPQIIEELQLAEHGLEIHPFEPQFFTPFPDGKHLFIWADLERTIAEIERFSKQDAKAYRRFEEFWASFFDLVDPTLLAPPPPLADLVGLFRGPEAEDLLRKVMMYSCKDFLDEYFEDDHVKVVLSTQALVGTMAGPRTPGTAYVMGHHLLGQIGEYREVWGWAKGGMGGITEALASAARAAGADLRTSTPVKQILVKGGRATGVELEDGTKLAARAVVSTVDPKLTFLKLVGPDRLPEPFVRGIEAYKTRGAAYKVNAVIKGLPDFTCLPGTNLGPQHTGSIEIVGPNMDYVERAYDEAKYGEPSRHPWFELTIQSAVDPSVTKPGYHVCSMFCQYAPEKLARGKWEERREEMGDRVVETLAEYAPNVPKAVVHRQVLTPKDFEGMLGLTGGNIFQGDVTPDQILSFRPLPGWAEYRTPVEGLYLGGSGAHPGGGVLGAPGHNVAQVVLQDVKAG